MYQEKSWNPFIKMGCFREESKKLWMPVSTYLIEHPKGLILIDTGWHHDVRENQRKHLGCLSSVYLKPIYHLDKLFMNNWTVWI
jgi:hypothetical protein